MLPLRVRFSEREGHLVVAVADFGGSNKELKGVVFFWVEKALFFHGLDLIDSFFAVRAEAEFVLVAPQHGGPRLDGRLGENVVQIHHLQQE